MPGTPYRRIAEQGGGCLAGTTLAGTAVALALAPCALGVSGIVLLAQHYTHIPDCASPYRAWCIVMTILSFTAAKHAANDLMETVAMLVEGGAAAGVVLGGLLCIPAAVGYAKVVAPTPATCDLTPVTPLHTWTWCVIGYFAAYAGGALALGCAASAEKRCRRDNEDHVVDV